MHYIVPHHHQPRLRAAAAAVVQLPKNNRLKRSSNIPSGLPSVFVSEEQVKLSRLGFADAPQASARERGAGILSDYLPHQAPCYDMQMQCDGPLERDPYRSFDPYHNTVVERSMGNEGQDMLCRQMDGVACYLFAGMCGVIACLGMASWIEDDSWGWDGIGWEKVSFWLHVEG